MLLTPAARLGHYEIVSLLGAGGMGEVYSARDTRLERTVALKVLTLSGSGRPESRLARFRREALAISRLSHPNICSLLDVGEQDGHAFLVMEHLEGESLADRLADGRMPLERALRHGIQIADALDAAHRQGIVHRDLKPANVMLTRDGVKLLDFGLAKLRPEATDLLAETTTGELTTEGTLLGTVAYMPPEHLDGRECDARGDIFALGVVLYEMICGRRPFQGDSKARVMAAILEQEPAPASSLEPAAPPVLDHVLKRCLAKDPDERWQTARDVGIALGWVLEGGSAAGLPAPVARGRERRARLTAALAGALGGLAAAALIGRALVRPEAPPPRPRLRLELSLDPPPLIDGGVRALALAPDASRLAYVSGAPDDRRLMLRPLSHTQSTMVPDSQGAESPFFSPDGQWVAFFAGGALKKVAAGGGTPVRLCAANGGSGGWGPDDTVVFSGGPSQGLQSVPASGGASRPLTRLAAGDVTHSHPHFLPGGGALLFTVTSGGGAVATVAQELASGQRRSLFEGYDARYVSSGHVVFTRGRSILAARFDPRRREVLGAPVAMQDDIRANQQVLLARSDLSASGSLVYAASIARAPRRLLWSDRAGRTEPLPAPPRAYMTPRLSHDGRRAALAVEGDVWLVEVERGGLTRLTQGPGEGPEARGTPIWSPDDRRIAYACGVPGGLQGVCSRAADGSGTEELLITRGQRRCDLGSWTPDGAALLFVEYSAETRHDVWSLALAGDRRLRPLLDSRYDERAPALSSDGRWLAYSSDESGRREVYARPFPGLGAKWVVSTGGGDDPVWSRDGRELFYRRGEETWAVSVRTRPEFKADVPRRLFRGRYLQYPNMPWTDFDVAADGRFLMLKLDGPDDAPLVMVVNWAEELKTRLPPP